MEKKYKNVINRLCMLASCAMLAACSSSLTYNQALERNIKKVEDSGRHADAKFLVDAASFNLLTTRMAEAAIENGYSNSLVTLAKDNLEVHEEMWDDLKKVARKEKMVLPAEMNDEHQRRLSQLTSSGRREFDRTYVRLLREAAQEGVGMFEEMATAAKGEEVRAFAARKLDVFKSHESRLETVDADLLKTY